MGSSRAPSTSTAKRKKNSRKTLLSSSRPNQLQPAKSKAISSTAGRAVIRNYHTLHKRLSTAVASKNAATERSLRLEIESLGGLEKYQDASFAGQGKERGGDTSSVLVTWLSSGEAARPPDAGLKMLEVGALDVANACAHCGLFGGGIERIDLNSRHPEIKEEDFMERPIPLGENGRFDIVSLSLVVNFVGDLVGRGDMLRRVSKYLRVRTTMEGRTSGNGMGIDIASSEESPTRDRDNEVRENLLPGLFLVLPAPCVNNSRYLDESRLTAMMESLGYSMTRRKMSSKLVYYLWRFNGTRDDGENQQVKAAFPKQEIRKGMKRNNFAIVLK